MVIGPNEIQFALEKNSSTARQKSDFLIKILITDRIRQRKFLLPVNQNDCDSNWQTKYEPVKRIQKKKKPQQWTSFHKSL